MFDHVSIGPSPTNAECAQVGEDDYHERSREESGRTSDSCPGARRGAGGGVAGGEVEQPRLRRVPRGRLLLRRHQPGGRRLRVPGRGAGAGRVGRRGPAELGLVVEVAVPA